MSAVEGENGPESDFPPVFESERAHGSPESAQYWLGVYRQMLRFCRTLELELTANADPQATAALRERIRHFEARLSYWAKRDRGE